MNKIHRRSLSKNKYLWERPLFDISDVEYMYEDDNKQTKVLLGKGSFATVYLVRHRQKRKLFALKVVF